MEKPDINEKILTFETSVNGADIFNNANPSSFYGRIVRDLNGNKFCTVKYYIEANLFGSYLVAAEENDPCRIAYEFGDLSEIDFWSRFGFIWEAIPNLHGGFEIRRIPMHNVTPHIHFWWCEDKPSPIEAVEKYFNNALTKWNPKNPHVIAAKKNYPLFQIALELRQKQWEELKKQSA